MEDNELEGKNYLVLYYKNTNHEYPVMKVFGTLFIRKNSYMFHIILDWMDKRYY